MYLSVRDLLFARGRFALVGGAVALITLLLVLLTGLTEGLGRQNTSGLERLEAARIVLDAPADGSGEASFTDSALTAEQTRDWARTAGAPAVERLGAAQTRAEAGGSAAAVAVLALEEDTGLAPGLRALEGRSHPGPGQAVLSAAVAEDLGVGPGDTVRLSSAALRVAGVTEDVHHSHLPVVWAAVADLPAIAHLGGDAVATALALPAAGDPPDAQATAAADAAAGTVTTDTRGAFAALPAYASERRSLLAMQSFLYGISALVVVSFLTVWTLQRTRDVAVLRALGASRGYLLRDALAQAAAVLVLGALAGALAGGLSGLAAGTAVPFATGPATVLLPALGVVALGGAGALLATRRVSSVDPLLALGGN
ncbi:FtsX-like permease family protein [Kocuria flava]|uniref:FtsX-like permease family protein n=1 Tax=Kocuria flava TaxID=446860 RepID=UPI003F1D80F4